MSEGRGEDEVRNRQRGEDEGGAESGERAGRVAGIASDETATASIEPGRDACSAVVEERERNRLVTNVFAAKASCAKVSGSARRWSESIAFTAVAPCLPRAIRAWSFRTAS